MTETCPECQAKLYERKTEDGFTKKVCFACGYYWNDSEGYSELDKRLFKKHLPTQVGWKASPTVGQPFTSPEHWTEPEVGLTVTR